MKNLKKIVSLLMIVMIAAFCLPFSAMAEDNTNMICLGPYVLDTSELPGFTGYGMYSSNSMLKDGHYARYIDRVNVSNEALKAYELMIEGSDNDGNDDFLIDDSYYDQGKSRPITYSNGNTVVYNLYPLYSFTSYGSYNAELETANTEVGIAIQAFKRDYPEVFWLNGNTSWVALITSTGEVYDVTLNLVLKNWTENSVIRATEFDSETAIKNMISQKEAACNSILADFPNSGTRYEQVDYLNDWLTTHNRYNSVDVSEERAHCCISALLEESVDQYAPVCEGYATAFKVLCDLQGIPCVLETGTAYGGGHMWNLVQMEDENWYAVDVTWNDPTVSGVTDLVSGYESDDYLLVGSDTSVHGQKFSESHLTDNTVSSDGIAFINGPVLSAAAYQSSSAGDTANGTCGDNLVWKFDEETGTLTISGTGDMYDYNYPNIAPWMSNYMSSIKSVVVESGVTSIGKYAFETCINLEKVTLSDTIVSIGNYAFCLSSKLKQIELPDGLQKLGMRALHGTSISALDIPASLTTITSNTLGFLPCLATITVDENNTAYCAVDNVLFTKSMGTLILYPAFKEDTSYTVPNGVTQALSQAFYGNPYLETLYIAENLHFIGGDFSNCLSLTDFIVSSNNIYLCSMDGVLYSADGKTLEAYPVGREDSMYTIPKGVTTIGTCAFIGAVNLEYVDIPSSVTSIEYDAFENCTALTSIVIPDGVTNLTAFSFANCTGLKSIVIPTSVSTIDEHAFANFRNDGTVISEVRYLGSEEQWNEISIGEQWNELLDINNVIYNYSFVKETKNNYVVLDNINGSVPSISAYVSSDVQSIVLSSGATIITENTFSGMTGVECISLPDTITEIETGAFADCAKLTDVCYTGINESVLAVLESANVTVHNMEKPVSGDIDWDGSVGGDDAITMIRYLSGWETPNVSSVVGDLNSDGKVDALDAIWLTRAVAGWEGYDLVS